MDYSSKSDVELEQLAQSSDAWAMKEFGLRLDRQGNRPDALVWWERSAALGNHASMRNLGVSAQQQGDWETAKSWLMRAVEAGSDSSCLHLGQMFHLRTVDLERAHYWYERGVALGETGCMNNLGILAEAEGDFETALRWYSMSADLGDGLSMANRARVLLALDRVEEAREWLDRAIASHEEDAQPVISTLQARIRELAPRPPRTQSSKRQSQSSRLRKS